MSVRIDKFLWAIRIFKTRSIAIDAINGGKVKLNGENIKPAKDIKVGEIYTIQLAQLLKTIKVLALLSNRVGAKEVSNYIEDLTSEDEYKKITGLRASQFVFRTRGTGRPTKKERRDIEEWFGEDEQKEKQS
jgi:ribosome-associated heat shock protein Hsp15